jgi:hypothetical protein
MNAIWDRLEQMFEELPSGFAIRLFDELGDCKLAGPVNAHKEVELAFRSLNLCDADMEKAASRRCKHRLSANGWGIA